VFENRVLRKILGSKWQGNGENYRVTSLTTGNPYKMLFLKNESRTISWMEHVARMEPAINTYGVSVSTTQGNKII